MSQLKLPDGRMLSLERPLIMGILNVTPDSFSDGGRHDSVDQAVVHVERMLAEGADVIDVGGESTRPGSQRVSIEEQIARTVEVIRQVHQAHPDVVISIDTTRSDVARAALDVGAAILNDVAAGREDERMFTLAAERGTPLILMHMQGEPTTMQDNPSYKDVVAEVIAFLLDRAKLAQGAGVPREQIVIDPGIGFGKTREHNLKLLENLNCFVQTGYPVLLGTSRKRFMGSICTYVEGNPPSPHELVGATCATTAIGVGYGINMFRVHDILPNRQAADVAWAIEQT